NSHFLRIENKSRQKLYQKIIFLKTAIKITPIHISFLLKILAIQAKMKLIHFYRMNASRMDDLVMILYGNQRLSSFVLILNKPKSNAYEPDFRNSESPATCSAFFTSVFKTTKLSVHSHYPVVASTDFRS